MAGQTDSGEHGGLAADPPTQAAHAARVPARG